MRKSGSSGTGRGITILHASTPTGQTAGYAGICTDGFVKSAIIIAGYFIFWALIHSALVSIRVKKVAEKRFGPETRRYYRLFFVLFAVVSLIPLVLLIFLLPDRPVYAVPSPWRWIMNGVQALIFAFMAWTVIQTEAMNFLGIEQIKSPPEKVHTELQTKGLYRIVRHPMYFTSILLLWCTPVMTLNVMTVFIGMTLYFYVGSVHEEQLLVKQFGEQYRRYRKSIPRIFPGKQLFMRNRN